MRLFVIAVTIVSLAMPMVGTLASPAFAQGRHKKTDDKTTTPTVKADDKAYKSALDRVPAPTQKYDPWGGLRPADDKH
jgi:hypothetical protein